MKQYTIDELKKKKLIIFEAIMGSHAYGTVLPTSDKDIRGVWMQPLEEILQYGYAEQVADEKNDIVYYELRRFISLLRDNNPNIVEILFAPTDCVLKTSPEWEILKSCDKKFLTQKCRWTFAGYAIDQIKKARGYNKKMNWEEAQMVRKGVLDFCYILDDGGSTTLHDWLIRYNSSRIDLFDQRDFSLAAIDHAKDVYAMYQVPGGIVSDVNVANDVQLCSIPKGQLPVAYLTFNKDAYSTHCTRYKEYQTWLKERNEDRVKMNKAHGKNYDSKNMMHTFRLLKVAIEIAKTGNLNVRRSPEEIEVLMKIRHGEYEYDDLLREAEEMITKLDEEYDRSALKDSVDEYYATSILLEMRKKRYGI